MDLHIVITIAIVKAAVTEEPPAQSADPVAEKARKPKRETLRVFSGWHETNR